MKRFIGLLVLLVIAVHISAKQPNIMLVFLDNFGFGEAHCLTVTKEPWMCPFAICRPGKIKAGSERDEIVHAMDLFPTLVKIAGESLYATGELG